MGHSGQSRSRLSLSRDRRSRSGGLRTGREARRVRLSCDTALLSVVQVVGVGSRYGGSTIAGIAGGDVVGGGGFRAVGLEMFENRMV